MDSQRFLSKLAEIVDEESVEMTDDIFGFENWDSLAALSLFAFLDSEFKVNISAIDIAQTRTPEDIWRIVLSKSNER